MTFEILKSQDGMQKSPLQEGVFRQLPSPISLVTHCTVRSSRNKSPTLLSLFVDITTLTYMRLWTSWEQGILSDSFQSLRCQTHSRHSINICWTNGTTMFWGRFNHNSRCWLSCISQSFVTSAPKILPHHVFSNSQKRFSRMYFQRRGKAHGYFKTVEFFNMSHKICIYLPSDHLLCPLFWLRISMYNNMNIMTNIMTKLLAGVK